MVRSVHKLECYQIGHLDFPNFPNFLKTTLGGGCFEGACSEGAVAWQSFQRAAWSMVVELR